MKPTPGVVAFGLLTVLSLAAQSPVLPQVYEFTATSNMMGPMTITVHRNGPKEVMEMQGTSGGLNVRLLYDFQAHRIYTVDLNAKTCTTQEYASPYAPVMHDPIGGAAEMVRETKALKAVGKETVNGIAARVVEAPLEGAQGKYKFWLEEKFGFPVKQSLAMGNGPERLLFEMQKLSYTPGAAAQVSAPTACTRIGGVTTATGGRAEMNVGASVQAEAGLGNAPSGKPQTGGGVLLGTWNFTGTQGGVQWRGTLVVEKLEANSFDASKYSNTCDLSVQSANSGKGVGGPCLYNASTRTLTFTGGQDANRYSLTAVLSADGASLMQGRWAEGAAGNGTWSAVRKR